MTNDHELHFPLSLESQGITYTYPLFKFMQADHAVQLLEHGHVYIPALEDFRDEKKYGGKIFDPKEGIAFFTQQSKNTPEIQVTHRTKVVLRNFFVFCLTRNFDLESLRWAMSEGKKCCVMLAEPLQFFKGVNDRFNDTHFFGALPCIYSGRTIPEDHHTYEAVAFKTPHFQFAIDNFFNRAFRHPLWAAYIKDSSYAQQQELRGVWGFKNIDAPKVPAIQATKCDTGKLILIHFDAMLGYDSKAPKIKFRVRALSANQEELLSVTFESLEHIFSPIVFKTYESNALMLGFCSSANIFPGGNVKGGLGSIIADGISIVGHIPLVEVQSIEYLCDAVNEETIAKEITLI